eukprot:1282257-Prymnesium_polylepis.1
MPVVVRRGSGSRATGKQRSGQRHKLVAAPVRTVSTVNNEDGGLAALACGRTTRACRARQLLHVCSLLMASTSASVRLKLHRSRSDAMWAGLSVPVTTATPRCSDQARATCAVETLCAAAIVLTVGSDRTEPCAPPRGLHACSWM